jgi:hypothetical protein
VADVADAVAAALAAAQASAQQGAAGGQGATPTGGELSGNELAGLRRSVSACWNKSTASSEAQRSVVTILARLLPDGRVESATLVSGTASSDAARQNAFDVAKRALRCIPDAALPPEKYDTWKEIEFEFDYNAGRVQ